MRKKTGEVYSAPWEKAFDRVLTPLEDFIHRQTTSAILLMLCAVVALYLANSRWNEAYHHPEDLLMAKTGILFASLISGLSGYTWLFLIKRS